MLQGGYGCSTCCNVKIGQTLIEPRRFVEFKHVSAL